MYRNNYIKACLVFFLSGLYVLSIGVIMPDMIHEWNLSYQDAGLLISMIAGGNLIANFLLPFIGKYTNQNFALSLLASTIPLGFLLIITTATHTHNFLWLGFMGLGLGRGAVSIVNNALVNDLGTHKSRDMNLMHMTFAIGAFLSGFIILFMKMNHASLNFILIYLLAVTVIQWLVASSMELNYQKTQSTSSPKNTTPLSINYWIITILLFAYVGVENTINGWFITYLQESNLLSSQLTETLVSLTWLMMMLGRIFTARISNNKNAYRIIVIFSIGAGLSFITALISTQANLIVASMLVLGFCLAGIYPTSVANASPYVFNNKGRLALLMTIASLGGIVSPQIIGFLADKLGMVQAVNVLVVNFVVMIVLALASFLLSKKATV